MIVLIGATGSVGSEVVKQLASSGSKEPVRALVRNHSKAREKLGGALELVPGDITEPASLEKVLAGADKLFLVVSGPKMRELEATVVAAAKKFGVKHLVYLSVLGAQHEAGAIAKWHRATEKEIEASSMKWTFIRPTSFMSNALGWVGGLKSHGKVFSPTGEGKSVPVDPRDIAAVAVAALTQPGHEGKAYDLTGPQALSMGEQVATLAKVTGKPFQFVDVTPEVARENMLKAGMPEPIVDGLLQYLAFIKSGQAGQVLYDFEKATGTTPRTFETWAKDHLAAFA